MSESFLAKEKMNILIYIMGSDLEEEAGAATQDIKEILQADIRQGTNTYLFMGGARRWFLDEKYNHAVAHLEIKNSRIFEVEKKPDSECGTTESLLSFINNSAKTNPAEYNVLIFWGHGCNGMQGIGYDSVFNNDTLTIIEIAQALEQTGIYWDLIGFDACNMATIETICTLQNYAKCIIASASNESVQGWPYHEMLPMVQESPDDMPIKMKQVIENSCRRQGYDIEMSVINCETFSRLNDVLERIFEKAPSMQMGIDILSVCEEVEDRASVEIIKDIVGEQYINTGIYNSQEEYEQLSCLGTMPQYCKWILRCNGWKE